VGGAGQRLLLPPGAARAAQPLDPLLPGRRAEVRLVSQTKHAGPAPRAAPAAGDPSWVHVVSQGHSTRRQPPSKAAAAVSAPRVGLPAAPRPPAPACAPGSGRRPLQQILAAEPQGREQWPGGPPAPDREVEKERLAALVGGRW
jgi:hypothetical protein